jgi:hypothetical protein
VAVSRTVQLTAEQIGIHVAHDRRVLKLIGSYVLARLLGFGILGAIVIYLLLSLLT